jgi:hypothetical protein
VEPKGLFHSSENSATDTYPQCLKWKFLSAVYFLKIGYGLGDRTIEVRFPAEAKGFFL